MFKSTYSHILFSYSGTMVVCSVNGVTYFTCAPCTVLSLSGQEHIHSGMFAFVGGDAFPITETFLLLQRQNLILLRPQQARVGRSECV